MGVELLTFDPNTGLGTWVRPPLMISGSGQGHTGRNEIYRITTTAGTGNFQLNARGTGNTAAIAGNATASAVQSALEAKTGIDVGDVIVTGGPLGSAGTPVFVEWTGQFAQTQGSYALTANGTTGLAGAITQQPEPDSALSMEELDLTPPASKPDWVGGADSEWQALADIPKYENRKITIKVRVVEQPTPDDALNWIAVLMDKLRVAQSEDDGIPLQWEPADVTKNPVLFDVLNGEVTDLPIGWDKDPGWFLNRPTLTVELTCKPYWRSSVEVVTSTTSTAAPLTSMEVVTGGDVPALGRIVVTDNATQTRRDVEFGIEGPDTYDSSTALIYDSDNLVTSGFAGTGTTRSGAYDPGAAGNSVIRASAVLTTPIAVCGTGALGHVGSYRVWGRFFFARQTQAVRLAWRAGNGPYGNNPWAFSPSSVDGQWAEVYLGTITIPTVTLGTQRWDGRIEAFENAPYTATPGALDVDYIRLTPVSDGFGRSTASYLYSPGTALLAYDQFTGITAGTALNARSAPSGGSWATSGATTDFAAADHPVGGELEARSTTADSGGRFAILGATNYTNSEVSYVTALSAQPDFTSGTGIWQGVVARWVDASNYARFVLLRNNVYHQLFMDVVVAGSSTLFASQYLTAPPTGTFLRFIVYATGFAVGQMTDTSGNQLAQITGYHSALATGGTLATGKPGIWDFASYTGGSTTTRYYDNFQVSTPAPEPVVINSTRSMQFRHDGVIAYDSGGTFTGGPPSVRGPARPLFPPGTSRVAVAARRVNLDGAVDDNVVDSTSVLVATRDRGLVVPR